MNKPVDPVPSVPPTAPVEAPVDPNPAPPSSDD